MPLVVKANLATELGICNGTRCNLVRIVFSPSTADFDPSSDKADTHFIRHLPLMIVIKIPPKIDPVTQAETWKFKRFEGLLPGEFPVFPMTKKFDHKYRFNGKQHSVSVQRTQFPLIPAYALTGYTAQGQTFDKAILDITRPKGRGVGRSSPADLYVLLSRIKTSAGVLILRDFQEGILTQKPNHHMLAEINRLKQIESATCVSTPSSGPKTPVKRKNSQTNAVCPQAPSKKRRGKRPQL